MCSFAICTVWLHSMAKRRLALNLNYIYFVLTCLHFLTSLATLGSNYFYNFTVTGNFKIINLNFFKLWDTLILNLNHVFWTHFCSMQLMLWGIPKEHNASMRGSCITISTISVTKVTKKKLFWVSFPGTQVFDSVAFWDILNQLPCSCISQAKSIGPLNTSLSLHLLSAFKGDKMRYFAEAKALIQFFYHTWRNCLSVLWGTRTSPPFPKQSTSSALAKD